MLKAVLTDIDGTITDSSRRINTGAINTIRFLVNDGIEVVLASGNTSCFMDALCKMIGTHGTFIAENGGVFRSDSPAQYVAEKEYGDGFVEVIKKYESYLRAAKRSMTI